MLIIASTDLQKEIVEGGRVSHPDLNLSPTVFVSKISSSRSVPFRKTANRTTFCLLRVQLPLRSSMLETLAGLRDSFLLPRLWDGEPQRWCKLNISVCVPTFAAF